MFLKFQLFSIFVPLIKRYISIVSKYYSSIKTLHMNKLCGLTIVLLSILASSCTEQIDKLDFEVTVQNTSSTDTLILEMDISDAIKSGIIIPGKTNQELAFNFSIKNIGKKKQKFFYKIYYQNESYKYSETLKYNKYNPKSAENFYGSWINHNTDFKETIPLNENESTTINESITIVGNPRNEERYFGSEITNPIYDIKRIPDVVEQIKASEEWYTDVKEKAKTNNTQLEEQLYLDAKWFVEHQEKTGNENNRWKRNPRVGVYSFMLVIVPENTIKRIPDYIRNIELKDKETDDFVNPYYYFLYSNRTPLGIYKTKLSQHIKVSAKMNIQNGIFVDPMDLPYKVSVTDTTQSVGYTDEIFENAHFAQFFHNIDKNYNLNNIPLAYDVTGNNYTREMYKNNSTKTTDNQRINDYVKISETPGTTVELVGDSAIMLRNEGKESSGEMKKENVGLQTRIGLTYGKFRAKIQFPEIISNDFVWNGLTCAFWLIYQEGEWNQRDICKKGYITKHLSGKNNEDYVKTTDYSEIDIEIVKTSKYWPKSSYGNTDNYPTDDALNGNVMVTCTNWDMACQDVSKYITGAKPFEHSGQSFELHRWDHWYKALTLKHEHPQTKTLGRPVYFEIEWTPTDITWRMGESLSNMQVIGYMNDKVTKIPNNQMVAVITQEFHDGSWWPTAPFHQNNVPFPLKDMKGYVYEMVIE